MNEIQCCTVACEKPLDKNYWDTQYKSNTIGWDLGTISTPIRSYIDSLTDKNIRILIPGGGNSYEAEYLLDNGFTNITVLDIAPTLVAQLREKFALKKGIQIVLGDFFEHDGQYDLIIEQTFFCALPPLMRQRYVWKMHQLLAEKAILAGLLFNRTFEKGPPFGGSSTEYEQLFNHAFYQNQLALCENSVAPRAGTELWFDFRKNMAVTVSLYRINGITCSDCSKTVLQKIKELARVKSVSLNTSYTDLLLVSDSEISIELLQQQIAFDIKYSIEIIK
jgi:SAM-dependent methyltransferase